MGRSSTRKEFRQTLGAALCTDLDTLARTVQKHGVAMQFLLTPGWRGLYQRFRWLFLGR